jgi:hypothetical protein
MMMRRKLHVAGFADSEHRNVLDAPNDPKVPLCHEDSLRCSSRHSRQQNFKLNYSLGAVWKHPPKLLYIQNAVSEQSAVSSFCLSLHSRGEVLSAGDMKRTSLRALISYALCVAIVVLSAPPLSATTLLALIDRKHHRVILAADSLLLFQAAQTSTQTCKIIAKPGCTFGMAGLFDKNFPVFHLKELADQACSLPRDLKHRADAFLGIAKDPVTEVAQYLREHEPQFYGELTSRTGGELVMVIFAGTENGNSAIYARGYKLDSNGEIVPVSVNVTENRAGAGFFAGSNQAIAAYIKANKKWEKMDSVSAARKFVQLEIEAHPEWVGPPVSIMAINKLDQQKWINPGVCAALPNAEQAGQKP